MALNTFKLGFIGGAPNSAVGYAHYVASRMDGAWDLQAGVFSRDTIINRQASQLYGVSKQRTYFDVDEMLKREKDKLDAIVILTPTDTHYKLVLNCLDQEIPVICEKALSLTGEETKHIRDTCYRKSGFLAVTYNYSGYPMIRELRSIIREGNLGDLLHIEAEMPQEGYMRVDENGNKLTPQDWRLKDGPIPTLHLDLAVHLHELIYYLTHLKPIEVVADQSSHGWFDVIDNASCLCRYTEGVKAHFWFSKCALGYRNGLRIRIFGTKASAEWYQANPEELLISYADGKRQILDRAAGAKTASDIRYQRFKPGHPAGFTEALANLYMDIYLALSKFKTSGKMASDEVYGADLALDGMLWLEAFSRSTLSQKWEFV